MIGWQSYTAKVLAEWEETFLHLQAGAIFGNNLSEWICPEVSRSSNCFACCSAISRVLSPCVVQDDSPLFSHFSQKKRRKTEGVDRYLLPFNSVAKIQILLTRATQLEALKEIKSCCWMAIRSPKNCGFYFHERKLENRYWETVFNPHDSYLTSLTLNFFLCEMGISKCTCLVGLLWELNEQYVWELSPVLGIHVRYHHSFSKESQNSCHLPGTALDSEA